MTGLRWVPIFAVACAGSTATADIATDIDYFGNDFRPPGLQTFNENGVRFGAERPFEGSSAQALPAGYWHTLVFHDGRRLHGILAGITKDAILWRRGDASELLRFARTDVRRVLLEPPPETEYQVGSSPIRGDKFTLRLSGGNWLKGQVTTKTGDFFACEFGADMEEVVELLPPPRLEPLPAPRIAPIAPNPSVAASPLNPPEPPGLPPNAIIIPRSHLEWLSLGRADERAIRLHICPMAMEGWSLGKIPRVEAGDGILSVQGAEWIGHNLPWRERFEVAFEVPVEAEEGLRISLLPSEGFQTLLQSNFADGPPLLPGTVAFKFGKAALQWLVGGAPSEFSILPLPSGAGAEAGPVSYRVFYDGIGRHVILLRNGRQLGDWPLPEKVRQGRVDSSQMPHALCLDSGRRGETDVLQLRRLDVLPWDGLAPAEDPSGADWLSTGKQPPVAGHVEALQNERMAFAGRMLQFSAETYVRFPPSPAPAMEAEALVLLGEDGEVSVADLWVNDGRLRGRTTFSPALDLPANRMSAIAFPPRERIPDTAGDRLIFRNGDELCGALLSAANGTVRWRLPAGPEVDFQTGRVAGVRLANESKMTTAGTVELRSGERVRGKIAAFDGGQLRWAHALLGELSIDRAQLWRLSSNVHELLRDGGHDPNGWLRAPVVSKIDLLLKGRRICDAVQAWIPFDGRFIRRAQEQPGGESAQGPFCQIGDGQDRFELRVDLASPDIYLCELNVDFAGPKETNHVQIDLTAEALSLETHSSQIENGVHTQKLPVRVRGGEIPWRWNVRAFVNGPEGTVDIYLNGRLIGRTGESPKLRVPGVGRNVCIQVTTRDRCQMVLPQVAVLPWSGQLPMAGATVPATVLSNGDLTTGVPTRLSDGQWRLESDIGTIDLPAEKLRAVEFGGEMQPVVAAGRLRLVDGSVLLVDRIQWAPNGLSAHHALFGDLKLAAGAVTELIFNPALAPTGTGK